MIKIRDRGNVARIRRHEPNTIMKDTIPGTCTTKPFKIPTHVNVKTSLSQLSVYVESLDPILTLAP